MSLILAINPGSISTKIAVYEDENQLWVENIQHSAEEIKKYSCIADQMPMRKALVEQALTEHGHTLQDLDAVAARGGMLCAIKAGAYAINQALVDMLRDHPVDPHASNLAAPIAYSLAQEAGIPSYIYDGVTVDEMIPLVRITGVKEIERCAKGHNLNMRAAALRYAKEEGKSLADLNVIVVHLGSGITSSLISGGKIIDMLTDEEGAFAPERAGLLPWGLLLEFMEREGLTRDQMTHRLKRSSGLVSHCGTSDMRDVEKMIADGDKQAALVVEAMALTVAKNIGKLSVTVSGKVDTIILTGSIAYSEMFTKLIKERVEFIAPVTILPGENEMQSLAHGVLRVLRGEEQAHEFGVSV